jgi:hypothetical protein
LVGVALGVSFIIGSYERRSDVAVATPGVASKPASRQARVRVLTQRELERSIAGSVRSERGAAIAGATVCATDTCQRCTLPPICTLSDERGSFVLTGVPANWVLRASARGYFTYDERLDTRGRESASSDSGAILRLESAPAKVAGRVVDATGGPIEGALVTAWTVANGQLRGRALTTSDGDYGFGADGELLELRADAEGYSRTTRLVQPSASEVMLVLAPASVIEGRLQEQATGEPIGGVMVVAEGRNALRSRTEGETNSNGTFRLTALPAGGYSVSALSARWRSDEAWVNIGVGQISAPILLNAVRSVLLSGSIVVAGEKCMNGRLALEGPLMFSVPAGDDGTVQVQGLLPGRYAADVSCDAALPIQETIEVGNEPIERRWDLSSGLEVRGRVETQSGEPVAGARVGVQPTSVGDETVSSSEVMAHRLVVCESDVQGEFACRGLTPGEHQCALLGRSGDVVRVMVTADGPPPVVVRAHASGTIRARVPGVGRHRLGEMVAFAQGETNPIVAGRPEGEAFVFEPLALDQYRVFVGSASTGGANTPLAVLDHDGQVVELELPSPALTSIAGWVVDDRDQPVPDAWVRASIAQSVSEGATVVASPVLTNDEGEFVITGILVGRYDVSVSSSLGDVMIHDVQGGDRQVRARLPTYGSLAGVVRTEGGSLVERFDLECAPAGGPNQRVAGLDGRWSLPWLAPGQYVLALRSQLGSATQTIALAAGERRTLDITLERSVSDSN